jgi:hypothetical protein
MSTGTTDLTEATASAIAGLPPNLALIQIENDAIMSRAVAHPRDYGAMLDDLKRQITAFPSFAKGAMYSKPCGKDKKTGKMKYATGLSVRSAEALLNVYKWNSVTVDVTPVDADTVKVEATFLDYQDGRKWTHKDLVSKDYTTAKGAKRRWGDDRFYNVVVKAAQAKCIRECVIRSVPPGLKSELEAFIDKAVNALLDDATVRKLVGQFANKGVTEEQLVDHMGKPLDGFTVEDRRTLLGVWNSIDQEEQTVAEIFGGTATAVPDNGKSAADRLADQVAPQPPTKAAPPKKQEEPAKAKEAVPGFDRADYERRVWTAESALREEAETLDAILAHFDIPNFKLSTLHGMEPGDLGGLVATIEEQAKRMAEAADNEPA